MKKILSSLALVALLLPATASLAQTDVDLGNDLGGRLSAAIDKKIVKGLHVKLEEEIRMDNSFANLDRLQTTVGITYKPVKGFKVGVAYAMINPYGSTNNAFKSTRHRLMADATASISLGLWQLSLKERFQLTHRTGDFNKYQNPANLMALKSRLMVKYKGLDKITPYAYFELRNTLNAPVINATYSNASGEWMTPEGSLEGDAGWFLAGFNGVYINRYRESLGIDIKLNRNNNLDLFLMLDHVSDKVVDANASGKKLKSYTREQGSIFHLGASYTFSF